MAKVNVAINPPAIDHESAVKTAIFQFSLVFAGALMLVVALVYFFPDHTGVEAWRPGSTAPVLGP